MCGAAPDVCVLPRPPFDKCGELRCLLTAEMPPPSVWAGRAVLQFNRLVLQAEDIGDGVVGHLAVHNVESQ